MTSDRLGEDVCEVSVNEIHQEPSQIMILVLLRSSLLKRNMIEGNLVVRPLWCFWASLVRIQLSQ